MKILLLGYGRMGRLIEQTALAAGDQIAGVVRASNTGELDALGRVADVAVDFSAPAVLPRLANYIRRTGTPLLSGTTGIPAEGMAAFTDLGRYAPVLHSANFSVGVAVFRRVLEEISGVLRPDFDIEIVETHHNHRPQGGADPGLRPPGHVRQAGPTGDRRPLPPGRHRGRDPHRQLFRPRRGP